MDYYASVGKRCLGSLIDYGIFYIALFLFIVYFGESNEDGTQYQITGMKTFIIPLTWFLYFPVVESFSGQTLGKKLLKIRVIRIGGGEVTLGDAFMRHLVDFIDLFMFGLIGIIVMRNSDKRQRVGDQLAKTIVVEDREAICMKCGERLVLSFRELERGMFICPVCKQENVTVRSLDKGFDNNVLDA
jgi:uncharacterized RDD family membrane protein YckC